MRKFTLNTLRFNPFTALISENTSNPTHTHEFWEIAYAINGESTHIVNDVPFSLKPFSGFLLMKPNDTHKIVYENHECITHRDIYIDCKKMRYICDFIDKSLYAELSSVCAPLYVKCSPDLLKSLEPTLNLFNDFEVKNEPKNTGILPVLHTTVITTLLGVYIESQIQLTKQSPDWLENFFDNLKNEDFLTKNISDIINELGYSHSYVCRIFKKHTSTTMSQCLNEAKIKYSVLLLMQKNLSITDIAYKLNYSSQSTYITAFKNIYNVSPAKWRKENLKQHLYNPQKNWGEYAPPRTIFRRNKCEKIENLYIKHLKTREFGYQLRAPKKRKFCTLSAQNFSLPRRFAEIIFYRTK